MRLQRVLFRYRKLDMHSQTENYTLITVMEMTLEICEELTGDSQLGLLDLAMKIQQDLGLTSLYKKH